jgi:hypothetical protein
MSYTTTASGTYAARPRTEQGDGSASLGSPYCRVADVGKPDDTPPPKGSPASILKASAIAKALAYTSDLHTVAAREMLTPEAALACLRQEGYRYPVDQRGRPGALWTDLETEILTRHYARASEAELELLFPARTLNAIGNRARLLGLTRLRK